ncbi:MAG TPA: S-adenosylmethionine decarboxylase [Chitinophagaceae bacterium]|jgi:S-adenosylmethionine decarboxylase|nr:S-adenosylmethionine decarboxylase [Chitinophagaceae bacterium]
MSYQPGLHLVATLQAANTQPLNQYENFRQLIDDLIGRYGLQKLGEVYHNFTPAGFTAVVCLSESHLSVHTWPEFGRINLDIYLSNYLRRNEGTVQELYAEMQRFFSATISDEHFLTR